MPARDAPHVFFLRRSHEEAGCLPGRWMLCRPRPKAGRLHGGSTAKGGAEQHRESDAGGDALGRCGVEVRRRRGGRRARRLLVGSLVGLDPVGNGGVGDGRHLRGVLRLHPRRDQAAAEGEGVRWRREAFPLQGVIAVAVVGLALFLCWWAWPEGGSARKAATEGVLLCAGSGAVSFALQRRTRTVRQALLVLVVMFGVRILIVVLGATAAIRGGGAGAMPF